jgi:hypothetical protein
MHNFRLDITSETVAEVTRLVLGTGLYMVPPDRLYAVISKHAVDGLLTKEQYDHAVRELIPLMDSLSNHDRRTFSVVLSTIFYSFDRTETFVVDALELCCGLSVLCQG